MIRLIKKTEHCTESKAKVQATLTLPWSKRTKSRQRVLLDSGEEVGLFLERGSSLRGGDILSSDDNFTVLIQAADELLSVVYCNDSLQLARLCYHLGNRHVDLQISSEHLCYPHDHVLDKMIQGLGFAPVVIHTPFEPETGAYSDGGHGHSHHG